MNKNWIWGLVVFILVLVIAGGVAYLLKPEWFGKKSTTTSPTTGTVNKISDAKASEYSAVFLSNNQVYFGKVSDLNSEFATLKEVYYLKVQNSLVPPQEGDVKVEGKGSPQPQQKNELTLIKMGNELHGPTDEIKINNKHILYTEALKTDSKVVKAINDYKEKNK
ncbi:hypothetical protein HY408_00120 [Candidatus Gottesmanbacteria bacterium]|nr:hypothetical protein [Candidatus Gottesmanbacteria bacterium]